MPLFNTSSTMKVPMRPIMLALEFQTSAVSVNPRKGSLSFGCTLGTSTPDGSFAALTLTALVLGDGGRHGVSFLLGLMLLLLRRD
uniref:Uncharacterized protein n=1 Tax=Arundo donax TaxID=35708 RepID=A0A0A9B8B5_ARUDO